MLRARTTAVGLAVFMLIAPHGVPGTHFVDASSSTPASPFTSWATAATNIQDAVDVAAHGATVRVTNGVYRTGDRVSPTGSLTRVVITNAITIESVNGAGVTVIEGSGPPDVPSVRGVYLGDGATLHGFTVTYGHTTGQGGGLWLHDTATAFDCVIRDNEALLGGGAYGGSLVRCRLESNHAEFGGGAAASELSRCVVDNNRATGNGGGVTQCVASNTVFARNYANERGGGAHSSRLFSCTLFDNGADEGGGVDACTVFNATLTANTASTLGGGATESSLWNSIAYYNISPAAPNLDGSDATNTCTIPMMGGAGNITNAPAIASLSNPRLLPGSPCADAGQNQAWMTGAQDRDGEMRQHGARVDMGSDELHAGALTGALQVAIFQNFPRATVGFPLEFWSDVEGRPVGYFWQAGDGRREYNQPVITRTFTNAGTWIIQLSVSNTTTRVLGLATVQVVNAVTRYVATNGTHTAPFTNWVSAATDIQSAINASLPGDTIRVGEGRYDIGGATVDGVVSNRITITNAVHVIGVHGPATTHIEGDGPPEGPATRCAYVGDGGRLSGFTLIYGNTASSGSVTDSQSGGGAWCDPSGVISNCFIVENWARAKGGGVFQGIVLASIMTNNWADFEGGGTYQSTVRRSRILRNWASSEGGGAYGGRLYSSLVAENTCDTNGGGAAWAYVENCTIVTNHAGHMGGGIAYGSGRNNIIVGNTATVSNNWSASELAYTCTQPLPAGDGNITNMPLFADAALLDVRLQLGSPCIDAAQVRGNMAALTDLAGEPRLFNSAPDMGALEAFTDHQIYAVLGGAYNPASGRMRTKINPPLASPYKADLYRVASLATDVVDWVLVELIDPADARVLSARAVQLHADGWIRDGSTDPHIRIDTPLDGRTYRIAIRHRNHLAVVSASAMLPTPPLTRLSFSNAPHFLGSIDAATNLAPDLWALIPGDADGDGRVSHADATIVSNQLGKAGYLQADLDLDGKVTPGDAP